MKRDDLLLISIFLTSPVLAAESDVLRGIMGEEVYRRSGVESLSEEQIEVLEQWVLDHAGPAHQRPAAPAAAAEAPAADVAGSEPAETAGVASGSPARHTVAPDRTGDVIRSRIDGRFEGWRNNDTRFYLKNGQVWEQRQPATFVTDLESPEVIIRENRFGHTMEVPAIGQKVHVRRIR